MDAFYKRKLPQEGTSYAGESLPEHSSGCPTYSGGGNKLRTQQHTSSGDKTMDNNAEVYATPWSTPEGNAYSMQTRKRPLGPDPTTSGWPKFKKNTSGDRTNVPVQHTDDSSMTSGWLTDQLVSTSCDTDMSFEQASLETDISQGNIGNKRKRSRSGAMKRRKRLQAEDSVFVNRPKHARKATGEDVAETSAKRIRASGSYAQALGAIKMTITTENYPATMLEEDIFNDLQVAIIEELVNAPDPLPQVHLGFVASGVVNVTCNGDHSAQWLKTFNGRIINGVTLKVLDTRDLPRPIKMAWKTKTVSADVSVLLNLMQRIHPEVNTSNWRIVDTQVEGRTTRRIILMDGSSAEYIKTKGYCLSTGIDLSLFKPLDVPERHEEEQVDSHTEDLEEDEWLEEL